MEGVPPSLMDDDVNQLDLPPSLMDVDVNQLDLQAQEDNFNMSELPSSFNQSSMLCNYQAGQKTLVDNDVIYDRIQQTTQFPPSFPQPMMEGAPPSFVDDNVSLTLNQLDFDTLMSELPPFSQIMTTMGHLDGTSSSWMNQNGPNWQQTPSSEQQWGNELPMSNQVPGMLPQPPMNQCSRQFPYQSNQVPIMHNQYDPQCSTMLPEPSQTLRQEEEAAARIQVSKITSSNSLHKEPLIKMTRPNVRFREYVVKLHDDREKCIFCDHTYGKRTSSTRIGFHLSGVKGKGVRPCVGNVPEEIKEAALGRDDSSSTAPGGDLATGLADQSRDTIHAETAFLLEENSEIRGDPLPTSSTGAMMMAHQQEHLLLEDPLPPSIIVEDEETRGDPSQPTNVSSRIPPGEDLISRLAGNDWERIHTETAFLFDENSETRGDPIPTSSKMLVGRAFEANARQIRSWIMDDKVSTIGICGMAGVGKTELLKHLHNELLQSKDIPHHLYWVPVSQNCSIERLQNLIAKCIGLDLSSEDDDLRRSVKLSKELRQNKKWILILDDLWVDCPDDFELDTVGIPETIKGCKLIVSTRSQDVCRTVADRCIRVNPLSHEEAVSLFKEKLGPNIELSQEKSRIADCIVNKCDGLPLGIKAMARSMKRLCFNRQWDKALKYLEKSSAGQSPMERVFLSLKSSYDHLKKYDQKEGFLYCALFPKGFLIPKDELIAYLIDEGVISNLESREAEFCRGHGLLDRLEEVCLLESIDGGSAVKMHHLIREMAIEIYQKRGEVIIKAGENLKNLSGAREWEESLLTASLIENQIKEIPSRHSPRCPKLSTLLLLYNRELELIDDTFFNQLLGLKILDLSHTVIVKLPDSVSNLVGLTTLLLIDCKKLVHVPSLEKLRKMRRLDLYRTALENIPQGLECLSELRYLRMSSCGQKNFPGWVLRKLYHLQVLILGWGENALMTVKEEEVGCLENLEILMVTLT